MNLLQESSKKIKSVKILLKQLKHNSLSNCYLFYGPKGVGKEELVLDFVKAIRCENKQNRPCLECGKCLAVEERIDEDLIFLKGSGKTRKTETIKIDQIRQVKEKVSYKTYKDQLRIVVIKRANNLTNQAANSILKTLEEDSQTIFILTADSLSFPPTITSRAQLIYIPPDLGSNIESLSKADSFTKIARWTGLPRLDKDLARMGADVDNILKVYGKLNNQALSDRLELVNDKLLGFGLENILLVFLIVEREQWFRQRSSKRRNNLDLIRTAITDQQRTNLNSKILLKNIFINYQ